MITQKKVKIIKFVIWMLLLMTPVVFVSYYGFIYKPLFTWRESWSYAPIGHWFGPPRRDHPKIRDGYRNAGIVDLRHGMILILTLPIHHKSQPDTLTDYDLVSWCIGSNSKSTAKFHSNYDHSVEVHLQKNSFVVVDGVTGEELIVHPVTKKEIKQWNDEFRGSWERSSPQVNLLEECFKFFSLPEEKFHEIHEKVNQHDTSNEREPGDGFGIYDGKVTVYGPERKNKTEETNDSTDSTD